MNLRERLIVTTAIAIAVIAVLAVGLVYTQRWSKIVIQVDNQTGSSRLVNMDIDQSPRTSLGLRQTIGNDSSIDGTWTFSVTPGNHLLWVRAEGYNDTYFTLVNVGPLGQEIVLISLTWYNIEGP